MLAPKRNRLCITYTLPFCLEQFSSAHVWWNYKECFSPCCFLNREHGTGKHLQINKNPHKYQNWTLECNLGHQYHEGTHDFGFRLILITCHFMVSDDVGSICFNEAEISGKMLLWHQWWTAGPFLHDACPLMSVLPHSKQISSPNVINTPWIAH